MNAQERKAQNERIRYRNQLCNLVNVLEAARIQAEAVDQPGAAARLAEFGEQIGVWLEVWEQRMWRE